MIILHEIEAKKRKIRIGNASVWAILAVSFAASVGFWYVLSGVTESKISGFWSMILWLVVAVGAVSEIIKKLALSTFRHQGLWLISTLVSVVTVLGTYQILDANKQNTLIKQSDAYQQAMARKSDALDKASKYAHAANYVLDTLESDKQKIVEDRNKRKMSYALYKSKLADVEQKIADKRQYDAANNTATITRVEGIAETNVSSNPLLSNAAKVSGIDEDLIKTLFFLLVTLLLEYSAFFIGGETEKLEHELRYSQAELLDQQNLKMFGFSMAQMLGDQSQSLALSYDNLPVTDDSETKAMQPSLEKTQPSTDLAVGTKPGSEANKKTQPSIDHHADKVTDTVKNQRNTVELSPVYKAENDSDEIQMKKRFEAANAVPVGAKFDCTLCGEATTKNIFSQRFCSTEHRKKYHALMAKKKKHSTALPRV